MSNGIRCSAPALALLGMVSCVPAFAGVNVIQKAVAPVAASKAVSEGPAKNAPDPEVKEVSLIKPLEKDAAAVKQPGGNFGPGRIRDVVHDVVSRYGYGVDWSEVQAKEDEAGLVYRFEFPIHVPGTSIKDDLAALARAAGTRAKFVFEGWEDNRIIHVIVQE